MDYKLSLGGLLLITFLLLLNLEHFVTQVQIKLTLHGRVIVMETVTYLLLLQYFLVILKRPLQNYQKIL